MNLPIAPEPLPQARECCPTSTRKRIEFKHAVLVDVRERDEVKKLALDVSEIVNIPLSEFEQRFRELPRDRELVLVSTDGQDSLKATYYLMREGYTDVLNMTDGIAKWVFRGFPIKSNPESLAVIADSQSCCSTPSVASG